MKPIVLLLALAICTPASSEATTHATNQHAAHATRTHSEPPAQHSTDLGLKAVGLALGFVSPENVDGTFSMGVFADCGKITPRIAIEPHLDTWGHSEESFGAKASIRDVALGARGKYMFEVANPKIQPFAGAGLGLHFLHAEVTVPAQGGFPEMKAEDSTTKLGLDLGGGVSMPINPRSNFLGEVWYGIVSDVSQFSLRAGITYRLGS